MEISRDESEEELDNCDEFVTIENEEVQKARAEKKQTPVEVAKSFMGKRVMARIRKAVNYKE